MRSGIRAQWARFAVLGSALLSLVFAACSLNPQPIPPGARAGADAGMAAAVPSQDSDASAGGALDATDANASFGDDAAPTNDGGGLDGEADGGSDATFDGPDGAGVVD